MTTGRQYGIMARMAVTAVKTRRATGIAMFRTKKMKAATIPIVAAPGLLFLNQRYIMKQQIIAYRSGAHLQVACWNQLHIEYQRRSAMG